MTDNIRWGILGTGNIAHQFAHGLQSVPDAELVAIASRSQERADSFGDEFGVPNRYPSYEAFAADAEVDAVYISTPHPYHKDNTILCLEAGKAVLCEKPFAINATEAAEMIRVARERKVFLMEAMWSRFFPAYVKLRALLSENAIGEVRQVTADFGFRTAYNPKHRLFDPKLGGGALLDVGIYPVSFASSIYGKQPAEIRSLATKSDTGVDEMSAYLFQYDDGALALLSAATRLRTQNEAFILGTEGYIKLPNRFWMPDRLIVQRADDNTPQEIALPFEGNGYNYEAIEVGNCLWAGKLESDIIPLDETLQLMQTLDTIRAQWGLKYPGEA